jgi:nucleoside-diphosphate-sugar epimerase
MADWPTAPVLVTGATGFTGGHLARRLRHLGHDVRALVRRRDSARELEAAGITVVEGDVRRQADVMRAVKGVRGIYHLAAAFRVAGQPDDLYREVNVRGTENVVAAARRHGVERLVHCSTIGVHGDVKEIPSTENSPFNPGDIYQQTKLEGELVTRAAIDEGLPAVIVRPASIYGPGDLRILKLFRAIQARRFLMFGSGTTLWHPVYIDDLVDGFLLCGEREEALGRTYILADERHVTLREWFAGIARAVGVPRPSAVLATRGLGGRVRGGLPPAAHRSAALSQACRVLRQPPRLPHRQSAARVGLSPEGGHRGWPQADRRLAFRAGASEAIPAQTERLQIAAFSAHRVKIAPFLTIGADLSGRRSPLLGCCA